MPPSLASTSFTLTLLGPRSLPDDKEPFVRVGSLEMKGAHAEAGAQTANLGEIAIGDSK
jgi:hypothetical protein